MRSEARHTVGRNLPNGSAFIWVNNEDYAPKNEGYNVVVFDALSGWCIVLISYEKKAKDDSYITNILVLRVVC